MNFEETQQGGQRSRALLGIALVVVLLVAAGALFFVWRPEAYQGAVAALTSSPQDTSEPLVSAGAHIGIRVTERLVGKRVRVLLLHLDWRLPGGAMRSLKVRFRPLWGLVTAMVGLAL